MAKNKTRPVDPDDMFSDTRMSFGDHLEELRIHLWRAIIGFFIAMCLSFFIGKDVLYLFIIYPVEGQLNAFYDQRLEKQATKVIKEHGGDSDPVNQPKVVDLEFPISVLKDIGNGKKPQAIEDPKQLGDDEWVRVPTRIARPLLFVDSLHQAQHRLDRPAPFRTFSVTEAFMVWVKICMMCGLVLGSPWIFYQVWSFVAAGLYPHEKKYVHIYLPFSIGLFVLGVLCCQFIVMPRAVGALLLFNQWLDLEPDLRLNEWLGFAIWFPVIFGLSFQTPLIMMFMERIGLFTVETYRSKRRLAFLVLAFVAAIGPSVDAFSMLFQWVALCLLYELGIWLCLWSPRKPAVDIDAPEPGEMVEV